MFTLKISILEEQLQSYIYKREAINTLKLLQNSQNLLHNRRWHLGNEHSLAQNDCTYSYREMAAYHNKEVVHCYARHPIHGPYRKVAMCTP